MTEAEWLACDDPGPMLESLGHKADPRKLRLFAAACARRLSGLLDDERSRRALDVAERYADRRKKGPPSRNELRQAEQDAWAVAHALNGGRDSARYNAAQAATEAASSTASGAARRTAEHAAHAVFGAPGPPGARSAGHWPPTSRTPRPAGLLALQAGGRFRRPLRCSSKTR
jgi:hypothetical protein